MKIMIGVKFFSILFFSGLLLCVNNLQANSPEQQVFEKGNALYLEGKFNEAIVLYTSLLEADNVSATLFYNLGNAYFKANRNVEAILYYEKALKENPRNENYVLNLAIANNKMEHEPAKNADFFIKAWWKNIASFSSSSGWAAIALLLFWIGVAGILIWMLATKRQYKKIGFFIAPIFIMLSIIPFLLANSRANFINYSQTAIVMQKGESLKTAPESKVEVLAIEAGTKVNILDVIGKWKKVKAPDGEIGWLNEMVLTEI